MPTGVVDGRKLAQREVAIEAVRAIGMRQICDIDLSIFGVKNQEREMVLPRIAALKKTCTLNKNQGCFRGGGIPDFW